MQRALSLPNMAEPSVLVDLATTAESNGWDGVFLWDHLLYRGMEEEVIVDPWVTLGAIAQATTTITIGTLVTPLARRRPQKVAKEIATLDRLSGGRAVLGVGLGVPLDYEAFGEAYDGPELARKLDAGLEQVASMLGDGRPKIWVAGRWPNRAPLRRAARWDGYAPIMASPDGFGLCRPDDLRAIRAALGDDVGPDFDLVTSQHWEHTAEEYADAGVTWLTSSWNAEPGWVDELADRAGRPPA